MGEDCTKLGNQWMLNLVSCMAVAVTLLLVTACREGASNAPPSPAVPEKLAQLETSGVLPSLDRLPLLGGMDANRDGVRDDIALHIEKAYSDPVQRRAAMQMARVHQSMLLVDKHDHIALQDVSERSTKAIACLHQVFSMGDGPPEGTRVREEIRAMTTNTKERLQRLSRLQQGAQWIDIR